MKHELLILAGFICLVSILTAELIAQLVKKRKIFNLSDSTTNTAFGISDRVFSVFWDGFMLLVFTWIYDHLAPWHIPVTPWSWLGILVLTDLLFYCYHRAGHETRFFWAIHSAHHQSEEYNLTVGFRISIFQTLSRSIFYCFIPLCGFDPLAILSVLIFHGIYQLPLHTKLIPKLGPLEYILVTPSHHRVHHASNEKYLDRNYGGVFIIWDRMFGTFQKEEEEPVYGLTEKTGSMGFIFSHFHGFRQIKALWSQHISPLQKLDGLTRKPSDIKGMFPPPPQFNISNGKQFYAITQLLACAGLAILLIYNEKMWPLPHRIICALMVAWSLLSLTGRAVQTSNRITWIEIARNLIFPALCFILLPHGRLEYTSYTFYTLLCLLSLGLGLGWIQFGNKPKTAALLILIFCTGKTSTACMPVVNTCPGKISTNKSSAVAAPANYSTQPAFIAN